MARTRNGNIQLDNGTISERVIATVAAARNVDPLDLPPLYDVIEPDALDQLFQHRSSDGRKAPGRVVFMLANCEVVVHSDGDITVTAPDERSPASPSANSTSANSTDEQDETGITLD